MSHKDINISISIDQYEREKMQWFINGWEEVSSCANHEYCDYHDMPKYEYIRDCMDNDNPLRQIFYDEWLVNWKEYAEEDVDTKESIANRFPLN